MEYALADNPVTSRIEAMRSMLAGKRENAGRRFDKFMSMPQNSAGKPSPSGKLANYIAFQ